MLVNDQIIPDFSGVEKLADIQQRFFSSARSIMGGYFLKIRDEEFKPTSLELYLKLHNQRDLWWDSSTDTDDVATHEQSKRGTWYVRQVKGQHRWRIDITAGNADKGIQAGILVRQLDGRGGVQPGPAVALHRIIRGKFERDVKFNEEHLDLIRRIHGKRIDGSDGSPLILKKREAPCNIDLARGKRINISKKTDCSIRKAELRVSVFRKWSDDTPIHDPKPIQLCYVDPA